MKSIPAMPAVRPEVIITQHDHPARIDAGHFRRLAIAAGHVDLSSEVVYLSTMSPRIKKPDRNQSDDRNAKEEVADACDVRHHGGASKIGLPSLMKVANPPAMVSMASVIMNDGMPT